MSEQQRAYILTIIARYTGRIVPARFRQRTGESLPGVDRLHYLISGIYKPAWSEYALSIVIKVSSPYEDKDEVIDVAPLSWRIRSNNGILRVLTKGSITYKGIQIMAGNQRTFTAELKREAVQLLETSGKPGA